MADHCSDHHPGIKVSGMRVHEPKVPMGWRNEGKDCNMMEPYWGFSLSFSFSPCLHLSLMCLCPLTLKRMMDITTGGYFHGSWSLRELSMEIKISRLGLMSSRTLGVISKYIFTTIHNDQRDNGKVIKKKLADISMTRKAR